MFVPSPLETLLAVTMGLAFAPFSLSIMQKQLRRNSHFYPRNKILNAVLIERYYSYYNCTQGNPSYLKVNYCWFTDIDVHFYNINYTEITLKKQTIIASNVALLMIIITSAFQTKEIVS